MGAIIVGMVGSLITWLMPDQTASGRFALLPNWTAGLAEPASIQPGAACISWATWSRLHES
jgi:hypothetical protein